MSSQSQIKGLAQSSTPSAVPEGSLWYDTTNNILQASDGTTYNNIGTTSFSSAAVVSHSTTIGDYSTPTNSFASSDATPIAIVSQTTGGGAQNFDGNPTRIAEKAAAGSALIGKTVNAFRVWLSKSGSPAGTITARVRNSADTVVYTFNTLSASTLTGTSTATTFTNTSATYTIVSGDRLCIEYTGDATDYVIMDQVNPTAYDTTLSHMSGYESGAWNDTYTDYDIRFELLIYGAQVWDGNTATDWVSSSENNPYVWVDMGSALNLCAVAIFWDSVASTETEIKIQVSTDASTWVDKRKITTSNLTNNAYNYYRFNIAGGYRYVRVYGTGTSKVLSISEIKVMSKTDAQIFNDLGILSISSSDTALDGDGA